MTNKELIEFVFRNEEDIIRAVWERKNDNGGRTGGGGHCNISDPTAISAIRRADDLANVLVEYKTREGFKDTFNLRNPEKWLRVVKHIKAFYANPNRKVENVVLKMHYLEDYPVKEICQAGGFSPSLYNIIRHEILTAVEIYAGGMGLVSIKY